MSSEADPLILAMELTVRPVLLTVMPPKTLAPLEWHGTTRNLRLQTATRPARSSNRSCAHDLPPHAATCLDPTPALRRSPPVSRQPHARWVTVLGHEGKRGVGLPWPGTGRSAVPVPDLTPAPPSLARLPSSGSRASRGGAIFMPPEQELHQRPSEIPLHIAMERRPRPLCPQEAPGSPVTNRRPGAVVSLDLLPRAAHAGDHGHGRVE